MSEDNVLVQLNKNTVAVIEWAYVPELNSRQVSQLLKENRTSGGNEEVTVLCPAHVQKIRFMQQVYSDCAFSLEGKEVEILQEEISRIKCQSKVITAEEYFN